MTRCVGRVSGSARMDMCKRVAIIVAMEREIAPLLTHLKVLKWGDGRVLPRTAASYVVAGGAMAGALIVVAGIGRKAAAVCTRIVVDRFQPERLLSVGLAGALCAEIRPGQVLRPRVVVEAGTSQKYVTAGNGKSGEVLVTATSVLSRHQKEL